MNAHSDVLNHEHYSCTITINIEMILFPPFRPLFCLSFDLRILIDALASSNSSYLCYECNLSIIDDLL